MTNAGLINVVREAYDEAQSLDHPAAWADAVDAALEGSGIATAWDAAMEAATNIVAVTADGRAVEYTDDGRWLVHPWAFRSQIIALSTEAAAAGDLEMVSICDAALDRDATSIIECGRVIADARAQW